MNKVEKIQAKIAKTYELLEKLNEDFLAARREINEAVKFSRRNPDGGVITLTFGDKQYKVTKNSRGRFCVKLSGKTVNGDYTRGMNDLRYDIATGKL